MNERLKTERLEDLKRFVISSVYVMREASNLLEYRQNVEQDGKDLIAMIDSAISQQPVCKEVQDTIDELIQYDNDNMSDPDVGIYMDHGMKKAVPVAIRILSAYRQPKPVSEVEQRAISLLEDVAEELAPKWRETDSDHEVTKNECLIGIAISALQAMTEKPLRDCGKCQNGTKPRNENLHNYEMPWLAKYCDQCGRALPEAPRVGDGK